MKQRILCYTYDNQKDIIGAEFIILTVKSQLIKGALRELKLKSKQIIICLLYTSDAADD